MGAIPTGSTIFNQLTTTMLNSQDQSDKHLLRLRRELRALRRKLYVRVTLKEPIQRGWRRFHVLAPAAEDRADKSVLLALLEVIGTVTWRKSPDFRKVRDRRWRRRFVEVEQPLRVLTVGEWNRRRLPEEWLRYFRRETRSLYCAWLDALVFTAPYVFELQVEPCWVTETWTHDSLVAQRMDEIRSWLWHHNAMHRMNRLRGESACWRDPRFQRLRDRIAQEELRDAARNFPEVEPVAPARRIRLSPRLAISHFPRRSPTSRGTPLRPEPVRVQILPPGPFFDPQPLTQRALP